MTFGDREFWIYRPSDSDGSHSSGNIGIVSQCELVGIASGISVSISPEQHADLTNFTEFLSNHVLPLVRNETIGGGWLIAPLDVRGSIRFDLISQCLGDFPVGSGKSELPHPPFVSYNHISKRLYRIQDILPSSPNHTTMLVNNWGSSKQECPVEMTVSEFYVTKYGVAPSRDQHVLVGSLGLPVQPFPLYSDWKDHLVVPSKPSVKKEPVYLLPEFSSVHPINVLYQDLRRLPHFMFWLETGALLLAVSHYLSISPDTDFSSCHRIEWFLPRRCEMSYKSPVISLLNIALTTPSADIGYNYERLEWLGDSVWRLIACIRGLENDDIRAHYSILMSNDWISDRVSETYPELHTKLVLSKRPLLKSPHLCRPRLKNFEILADIAEALLAVAFICGGIGAATEAATRLGLFDTTSLVGQNSDRISAEDPQTATSQFTTSHMRSAVIRLECSLSCLTDDTKIFSIGQLNDARNKKISAWNKRESCAGATDEWRSSQYCSTYIS